MKYTHYPGSTNSTGTMHGKFDAITDGSNTTTGGIGANNVLKDLGAGTTMA